MSATRKPELHVGQSLVPVKEEMSRDQMVDSLFMMGLRMFGNAIQSIVELQTSRFGLEQLMITAVRYQRLRQAIQQGKRMRLGQMQNMISRNPHRRESVMEIAQLIDLPVDVVQAAVKRWIFF